jgi:hypothetical protein
MFILDLDLAWKILVPICFRYFFTEGFIIWKLSSNS